MLQFAAGALTLDGANNGLDIPPANYANANTINTTAFEMRGFRELLGTVHAGVVVGTAVVTVVVQECDTSGGTYANVADAVVTFTNAAESNLAKRIHVNWADADRKRYARLQGLVTVANAAIYSADTLRLNPVNEQASRAFDDAITQA